MSRVKNKRSQNRAGRPDSKSRPPELAPAAEITIESAGELEALIEARRRHERIQLNRLLERVNDPADLLRRVQALLAPGGEITATVANAQHYRILRGLFNGAWLGAADPMLPAERLRFFTRRELEKLFYRTGYALRNLEPLGMSADTTGRSGSRSMTVHFGELEFDLAKTGDAQDILPEAFRVTGVCEEPADFGLTSIVILTHNQWEYTRRCLESIRFRTDEPYELIVVDNGSSDGTPQRLSATADVRLIANAENRGFPAGVNQGIQAARGRQVLLLNNDVVVTTGWLRRQLAALHKEPAIGLVGPCSNEVSGPQRIDAEYDDLSALDGFAWEWGKRHAGQLEATDRLVGFCLLIRKSLVDEIGLFDERFGIGNFEDDDYCLRAIKAGYQAVIARDAFVHHFGHRTFMATGTDFNALLHENRQRFLQKWSETGVEACEAFDRHGNCAPPGRDAGETRQPQLSLCMIVRDNERTIRPCLESIRPWVDEMIVVDTGSKDDTPVIAAELGAKVYHFPWCDSFAAARNESLKYARGAWIFWMDSDDVIDADNGRRLQELVHRPAPANLLGYVMRVHCPAEESRHGCEVTVVDHAKVFRNRPDLRFSGRIHEQILEAIRRAGGEVAFTDLFVVHAGADHSPEGKKRKLRRDIRLLKLEARENPSHPFVHFNLGMTYADAGKHRKAIASLKRSLELSNPGESHVRKAYALLSASLREIGQEEAAWQACQEGRGLFPKDPELLFREGVLAHAAGQLRRAESAYLGALANDDEEHFSSIDRGVVGYKARHNLAVVYSDMGAWKEAENQWRLALAEVPGYREGWQGLVEALIQQGELDRAEREVKGLSDAQVLPATATALAARLAEVRGDRQAARELLDTAVQACPEDPEPLEALCRLLFYDDAIEAGRALERLIRLRPGDAAARHNLGSIRLRQGRREEAIELFEASLELRPDSAHTRSLLDQARDESRQAAAPST